MGLKISNNAFATLAASISDTVTSITLASGQGARFPSLGGSDYFYATLVDLTNNLEIVKCTARSGDVLTVVRGQDGSTARAYVVGDRIEIRPVAAIFDNKADTTYVDAQDATKMNYVAPGTAGNVLKSNGTNWVSEAAPAAPAGGFSNMQVFTSSGTFTVPAGITKVKVTVVGGGGNGGSTSSGSNWYVGGGGGGGGAAIKIVTGLSGGNTVSVTVGGAGGTSSFGAHCSATGGSNGGTSPANNQPAVGGNGGVGSGGNLNIAGTGGIAANGGNGVTGAGGSSILGGGARGIFTTTTPGSGGIAGGAYGGGGSGAASYAYGSQSGGAGASGVVIVEY